jgi:dolichyl-phosphate-mannose-protein mannosyltransferase
MAVNEDHRAPYLAAVLVLALAFLLQCLAFARANSQAYDEGVTLAAGLRLLDTGYDDVNLEHPPLGKAIVALPVKLFASPRLDVAAWAARRESAFGLGRDLFYHSGVPHERLLWLGRAPVIVLSLALVGLIGLFAWRTWGPGAGLLALALAAFDPTLVAHGSLIGLDLPLALWVTAGFFCISEVFRSRRPVWLWLAGVFAGLAMATKHSGPLFVAAMGIALTVGALQMGNLAAWWNPRDQPASRRRALMHALVDMLLVVAIAALVVRAALGRAGFEAYLIGIRAQLAHQDVGHPAFFLGEISSTGWVTYFPVALLMKLPPVTLFLAIVSAFAFRKGASWSRALSVVLIPLLCLLVSLLFARIDIGVRYALPLWPLIIVAASRVATFPMPASRPVQAILALAFLYHPVAAMRISPHDLAFFSDIVGGPARGRRYLSDSNLDWGQDMGSLGAWLASRERPRRLYLSYFGTADPRAYGVSYWPAPNACPHPAPWTRDPEPATGRELLAVSAMNLQGVFFGDTAAYGWLAGRPPVAELGYSISVYDITDDPAAHSALARMYERFGPADLAGAERTRAALLQAGVR